MKIDAEGKVIGKLIVHGNIYNLSNLLIATGNSDRLDFQITRDSKGNPIIPGSSFAGMMRSRIEEIILPQDEIQKSALEYLWGSDTASDEALQSHLIIEDLCWISDEGIGERDGVLVDYISGVSENKYDYEYVNPGAQFSLRMELTLRDGCPIDYLLQIMALIVKEIKDGNCYQGAFTSHAFGQLGLDLKHWYFFDFLKSEDHPEQWFAYLNSPDSWCEKNAMNKEFLSLENISLPKIKSAPSVRFTVALNIATTILIGSPNYNFKEHTDRAQLTNNNKEPIISSKSLRGALRHRMHRIINTLEKKELLLVEERIFGSKSQGTISKGRIRIQESIISDGKTPISIVSKYAD